MTARPEFERFVTEMLADDATSTGYDRVLAATLATVAATGQERHVTQRLVGDRLGRSRELRWTIAIVVLAVAMASALLAVGALRSREPLPTGPASNGWVAFAANGEAGDNLQETEVGRGIGKGDIYLARVGEPPRRVIGADGDPLHQTCPVFSPDGSRLAYGQLDMRSVEATEPPQPAGASAGDGSATTPGPPSDGTPTEAIVVVALASDGTPAGVVATIDAPATCVQWSPDGRLLAYLAVTPAEQRQLWVTSLDGRASPVGPPVDGVSSTWGVEPFAWSPDGSSLAHVAGDRVWLIPVDGSAPTSLPIPEMTNVAWSPDGRSLALGDESSIRIVDLDGDTLFVTARNLPQDVPATFAWSPDGRWLAWVDGTDIIRSTTDGTQLHRTFDVARFLGTRQAEPLYPSAPWALQWSPDGKSILVAAGSLDTPGSIIAVPWDPDEQPTTLAEPTYALRGINATWQGVHE